jgi:hypothetical protein
LVRKSTLIVGLVVATLLVPVAVFAAHSFNDVPDDHTFHDAIAWMKDNGVTVGCNPPANTNYCPDDNVTRGQMAAFMRRLAENQVVDAASLEGNTVAQVVSGFGESTPAGQTQTLAGIGKLEEMTVEAPKAGHLHITGSASMLLSNLSTTLMWLQLDNTTCTNSVASVGSIGFGYASTNATNARAGTAFGEGFAPVSAGSHTITLCGNQFAGSAVGVFGPSLSALFLENVTVSTGLFSADAGSIPGTIEDGSSN